MIRLIQADNPKFYELYPRICRIICFEDDISPLLGMMNTFAQVQNGNLSLEKANDVISTTIHVGTLHADAVDAPTCSFIETHITCDQRIKENVVIKDNNVCLSNIKNLNVYDYNFMNNIDGIDARTKAGFLAQQVESSIPDAVVTKELHGYTDFKTLDTSVILANLVGAVKYLIDKEAK